jgi:hypothetical protein
VEGRAGSRRWPSDGGLGAGRGRPLDGWVLEVASRWMAWRPSAESGGEIGGGGGRDPLTSGSEVKGKQHIVRDATVTNSGLYHQYCLWRHCSPNHCS